MQAAKWGTPPQPFPTCWCSAARLGRGLHALGCAARVPPSFPSGCRLPTTLPPPSSRFDIPSFYREARRILKPTGTLAAFSYSQFQLSHPGESWVCVHHSFLSCFWWWHGGVTRLACWLDGESGTTRLDVACFSSGTCRDCQRLAGTSLAGDTQGLSRPPALLLPLCGAGAEAVRQRYWEQHFRACVHPKLWLIIRDHYHGGAPLKTFLTMRRTDCSAGGRVWALGTQQCGCELRPPCLAMP